MSEQQAPAAPVPQAATLIRRVAAFSMIASALVVAVGTTVLVGWLFDIDAFAGIFPNWPRMPPGTAFGLAVAGVALACGAKARSPLRHRVVMIGAVLVGLMGLVKLGDHLFGIQSGIDRLWLINSAASAQIAPATACNFVLLGSALLLGFSARRPTLFQALVLAAGLIAWLGFSWHLYGGEPLLPLAQMAWHTAGTFLLLSAGVLCMRTDRGLMALVVSETAGGVMARRLLPAVVLVPIIAWLRLKAQQAGWFGTEVGLSVFALSNMALFGALVWATAARLHRIDAERKEAEEARLATQRILQSILNNSTTVIYVKDLAGRYLLVNRRYEQLFNVTQAHLRGKTDHELFSLEAANAFRAVDQQVATSGEVVEAEELVPLSDGPHTYISVKFPLRDEAGQVFAVGGISTDITERKRAEDAVRQSEVRYRTLFDTLIEGFCTIEMIFDADGKPVDYRFLEINPAFEKQTGLHDAQGKLMRDLAPNHEAHWFEIYGKIALTGEPLHFENEAKALGRYYDVCAYRVGGAGSRKVAILFNDITERKAAEGKIHAQLARLNLLHHITRAIGERQDLHSVLQAAIRSLENDLPIDFGCVCLYEPPGRTLQVVCVGAKSEPLAHELAMPEQATIPIDENGLSRCVRGHLVYESDIAAVPFPFPQRLARGGLRSLVVAPLLVESKVFGVLVAARREARSFSSGECEFLKQLSEHVALASHHAQLYGALQHAYDDLREAQQAIMQQERLRALGQMASGIAHDINNAISPASLYTESLLESEKSLSPRAREQLGTIQHALDDVAQTVARMREFYRQREPQLTLAVVDVNRLVQQVVDLTRARWNDMPQQRGIVIELRPDLAPEQPAIMGVESEIREALINLVFNAVDAMPEGGTLTLRTSVANDAAAVTEAPIPRHVRIAVTDTGVGMAEDTRRRCLEPFFTTKGERGTGLGLAMVYGMVQRHSADLEIESAVGRGTTMRLVFALPTTPATKAPATDEQVVRPRRLRLLIVDDDPLLLKSLRDILETDGHVIVTANDGQTGVNAFRGALAEKPFAAVITDLGMPHVDGRKVASAVKAASRTTPVILLTGWGQRLVAEGDVPVHVDHVLSKPPKLRDLREALMQCCPAAQP